VCLGGEQEDGLFLLKIAFMGQKPRKTNQLEVIRTVDILGGDDKKEAL
jgi:hypothetical protein